MRKIVEAAPVHSRQARGTGNGQYGICGGTVSNPLLERTQNNTPPNERKIRGMTA